MEISTGVVVPIPVTLHTKSDSSGRRVRTRVQAGRIPGPVIRGEGLMGDDAMLKGTTSKIGVVLERHADGDDDDEDSSWTTNSFYLPRSRTIPEVV